MDALASWHADWRGLRVLVLGAGVTGFSAADTLVELGCDVLVAAVATSPERAELIAVIGARLLLHGEEGVPGELAAFDPELLIVSPGYRPDHAILAWAAARRLPVWGDIELAWRLRDKTGTVADWITVTGTNGKTTTTQMAAHLLAADGRRVAAVGNIGIPVLDAIRRPEGFDVLVVELSSFQLHWIRRAGPGALRPAVSVCLNIADDHLDWHGSRTSYADAKATIYANTAIACVYNKADEATRRMVEDADVQEGCRAIGFGLDSPGPSEFGLVEGILLDRAFLDDRHRSALELTTIEELEGAGLAAPHMVANVLAAAALVRAVGVEPATVRAGLATFQLDHHRTETIAVAAGVRWVDDSKATNPHAADAALKSFDRVVWIVGGLLKGVDLSVLVERHAARLRAAVVIGSNPEPVVEVFGRHAPDVPLFVTSPTEDEKVMPQAVRLAAAIAQDGDVVLLAPAAASMDQFTDYEDRGSRFAEAVSGLTGRIADDRDASARPPSEHQPPTGT